MDNLRCPYDTLAKFEICLFRFKQVKHLESKVLAPLGDYGHQCKVAKVRIFASNNYDLLVMT